MFTLISPITLKALTLDFCSGALAHFSCVNCDGMPSPVLGVRGKGP